MADVTVIAKPNLTGKRLAFALAEDRIGHYAEFRAHFIRIFDLDRIGLAEPGFVQTASASSSPWCSLGVAVSRSRPASRSTLWSTRSNPSTTASSTPAFGRSCVG